MARANFRFYAELNDYLHASFRSQTITISHPGRHSVQAMIESLGVPPEDVDLIIVNGDAVDFSYIVQRNDQVSIYPLFRSIDITPLNRLSTT